MRHQPSAIGERIQTVPVWNRGTAGTDAIGDASELGGSDCCEQRQSSRVLPQA
jgi:hypothetical protein